MTDQEKLAKCREVLKFYATNDIHTVDFDFTDNGRRAREVLAETEVPGVPPPVE
jgi:hypothetical protein